MASFIELLFVLLGSFGFNLIPFASPSNLFIASNSVLMLDATDPASMVTVGFLVASGATLAKTIHYLITFYVSKHLRRKQRQRLEAESLKVKRWAFLLLFVAAATPIPDEPVVIPLGLLKYSPFKFFSAFFLGKLSITMLGAFLGSWTRRTFSEWLSPEATIALSVVLTIVITVILLKVDLGGLANRFLRRKTGTQTRGALWKKEMKEWRRNMIFQPIAVFITLAEGLTTHVNSACERVRNVSRTLFLTNNLKRTLSTDPSNGHSRLKCCCGPAVTTG